MLAGPTIAGEPGLAPVYSKDTWPTALVDRPLVLPHETLELRPFFLAATDYFAGLTMTYGATDRLEFDVAGTLCVGANCPGVRQAASAAVSYAWLGETDVNIVSALAMRVQHTTVGTSYRPQLDVALAWRLGHRFALVIGGGVSREIANSSASELAIGFSGRIEPRVQVTESVAVAPFLAFEAARVQTPSQYAMPLGLAVLFSLQPRFDIGVRVEHTDLTYSSTLSSSGVGVGGFVSVRL